jgi:hypothetical protein
MQKAKESNKKLKAAFYETGRNRMMYITYRFANFKEIEKDMEGNIILENDLSIIQPFPHYINVKII